MREWLTFAIASTLFIGSLLLVFTCVDYANAKETTTLEDALNRPTNVNRFVDKENGVVCYWADQYPEHLACVLVENPSWSKRAR